MIRVLFIGGCKHSQILEVEGGCIRGPSKNYLEALPPPDPWESDNLKIPDERPVRPRQIRTQLYRLQLLELGTWQRAWVYVLQGIELKQVEQVYLLEPGMAEKLRRIAF